jgi:hypothetical protein
MGNMAGHTRSQKGPLEMRSNLSGGGLGDVNAMLNNQMVGARMGTLSSDMIVAPGNTKYSQVRAGHVLGPGTYV